MHLGYYEAPPRKVVARDLAKLRAMGIITRDVAKEKVLSAWDIKGQRAVIIREVKEHKKAVTYFALSETGENLLSGSADKSIRVWKMVQHKLECVEVIQIREAVQNFEIYGDRIIVLTQNNVLKFSYSSRSTQAFYKSKHVRSLAVAHGKAYLGCTDLSVQAQKVLGNKWTEIAKVVSGRTDNVVNNRFSTLCKRRGKDDEQFKENGSLYSNANAKRALTQTGCPTLMQLAPRHLLSR
ncbi:hypothetical protein ABZP36_028687 [Zizania latifolia]